MHTVQEKLAQCNHLDASRLDRCDLLTLAALSESPLVRSLADELASLRDELAGCDAAVEKVRGELLEKDKAIEEAVDKATEAIEAIQEALSRPLGDGPVSALVERLESAIAQGRKHATEAIDALDAIEV